MSDKRMYAGQMRTEEQIERWKEVSRARKQRERWDEQNKKHPIIVLEEEDRKMPETFSFEEMFWHSTTCECGSCLSPVAKSIKRYRLTTYPTSKAVKSAALPLPELPDQERRLLLAFAERAQSQVSAQIGWLRERE